MPRSSLRVALVAAGCAFAACQHGGTSLSALRVELPDSAFVLPGEFSEQTTVADLQAQFGDAHVTITDIPDASGESSRGVVLFADDPTRRATVRFYEQEPLNHLASVTVTDVGSRWHGKLGVRIGTSFAALRERNGATFYFQGFDEAGEGMVRDTWNAGALDVAEGELLYFGVNLRLRSAATAAPHDEYETASDDPRYPALGDGVEVSAISAWSSLDDE